MADSEVFSTNDYGTVGAIMPIVRARSVTPTDSTDLPLTPTKGIIVTADGNLEVVFADDTSEVVIPVLAGVVYPFAVKQVFNTNTTATGIFALY